MWMGCFRLGKQRHWISRCCNTSPRSTTVHATSPNTQRSHCVLVVLHLMSKCSCRRYTVSIQPSTSTAPACIYRSPTDSRCILPSPQSCRHTSWNFTPCYTTRSWPLTWHTSSRANRLRSVYSRVLVSPCAKGGGRLGAWHASGGGRYSWGRGARGG